MKKKLAIVLVLAMLCSLLAGCGAKEEPTPAPAPEQAAKEEPAAAPAPEQAEAEEAAPEMEPIVLKYATSFAASATSTDQAQAAADRIA